MQDLGKIQSLTPKEKKVLEYILNYIEDEGYSPTFKEIQNHFQFASINSVQNYIKQLDNKGYLKKPGDNQKRALQVLKTPESFRKTMKVLESEVTNENLSVPLLGKVAAGAPIEHLKYNEYLEIPSSLVRNASQTYALQIQGDSMIDDGIFDGDTILVERRNHANDGEIVVAIVENEATVKRIFRKKKEGKSLVELRPSNQQLTSFWYQPSVVDIRGIVVGLIRKY